MEALIPGGYYMKARKIQESAIMHAPPHIREIWDLFLCRACHSDNKYLQRGQLRITYKEIREALHWMVGWRKMTYSKWDCEKALKWLKKATMITTRKTTLGMIVTVCNYDTYQTSANYESHTIALLTKATRRPQTTDTIYKNVKNVKNVKKNIYSPNSEEFRLSKLLLDLILERKPDYKKPNLQQWSIHTDRMLRLDGRSFPQVELVILWCQSDDFWRNNILSTEKLRKHFDKLELQKNERQEANAGSGKHQQKGQSLRDLGATEQRPGEFVR